MKCSELRTEVLLSPALNPAWKAEDGVKPEEIQPSPEGFVPPSLTGAVRRLISESLIV